MSRSTQGEGGNICRYAYIAAFKLNGGGGGEGPAGAQPYTYTFIYTQTHTHTHISRDRASSRFRGHFV